MELKITIWYLSQNRIFTKSKSTSPQNINHKGTKQQSERHIFNQVIKVNITSKSESEVAQSCPILCDPMDCSPPGSSVHGILQARILEWVAMPSLGGIFPTQGWKLCLLFPALEAEDFPGGSDGKASVYDAGDPGSIPGLGRSLGEGNGNPLQYYCLENPLDRGAWQATVHGVAKSQT